MTHQEQTPSVADGIIKLDTECFTISGSSGQFTEKGLTVDIDLLVTLRVTGNHPHFVALSDALKKDGDTQYSTRDLLELLAEGHLDVTLPEDD